MQLTLLLTSVPFNLILHYFLLGYSLATDSFFECCKCFDLEVEETFLQVSKLQVPLRLTVCEKKVRFKRVVLISIFSLAAMKFDKMIYDFRFTG